MQLKRAFLVHVAMLWYLSLGIGCGGQPVTVVVSPLKKDAAGQITAEPDKASMTSARRGASVTSGKTTVTLVAIGKDRIEIDVTHPDHAPQRNEVEIGSERDIFPGDATDGVRVRTSYYRP